VTESARANAEMIAYWNREGGPKWVALRDLLDLQLETLSRHALERAAVAPGDRVLDVGCGCGGTSLDLARRVGPEGEVVGVDVSAPMLESAQARAAHAGLAQLRFENADAQTHRFPAGGFDLLFSRFGVMFFADPVGAFRNLRRALRPRGRFTFLVWRALRENPWMLVPVLAAAQHIAFPPPPPPDAPGPFAFADAERVRRLLEDAGFADVAFEPLDEPVGLAGSLESAVEFLLQMGPAGAALRDAPSDARPKVTAAVREALAPYASDEGVRMGSAAWIVTGRNA
jgi:SAM-dependent methyltransferase